MPDQRSMVERSLTCTAARDMGGVLRSHPDRLAESLTDTRAGLLALADLIDRDRLAVISRPGLYADLARRLAAGDTTLFPDDEERTS